MQAIFESCECILFKRVEKVELTSLAQKAAATVTAVAAAAVARGIQKQLFVRGATADF